MNKNELKLSLIVAFLAIAACYICVAGLTWMMEDAYSSHQQTEKVHVVR